MDNQPHNNDTYEPEDVNQEPVTPHTENKRDSSKTLVVMSGTLFAVMLSIILIVFGTIGSVAAFASLGAHNLDGDKGLGNILSKESKDTDENNSETPVVDPSESTTEEAPVPSDISEVPVVKISGKDYFVGTSHNYDGKTPRQSDVMFAARAITLKESGSVSQLCADVAFINRTQKNETITAKYPNSDIMLETPRGNSLYPNRAFTKATAKPGETYVGDVCFDVPKGSQTIGDEYLISYASQNNKNDDSYLTEEQVPLILE